RQRVGKSPRPAVVECGWWAEHDFARQFAGGLADVRQLAQVDAKRPIELAQGLIGTVQPNWPLIAGRAQQGDQPLRLAEAVGADQMRAIGVGSDRRQELADLL